MKIYLNELSEEALKLDFTEKDIWVKDTITKVSETEPETTKKDSSGSTVHFEIRKLQDVILLKGGVDTSIPLLCSRCASAFAHEVSSKFESMFTREKSMDTSQGRHASGIAYSEPSGAQPEDLELVILETDHIALEEVLEEQLLLQIPYQPLCKEDCKGLCPVCGQDKNINPCQCFRLKNPSLANALKGFIHRGKAKPDPK